MKQPSNIQIVRGTYKRINGQWHRLCTGPAHEQPEYLPATEKYFHMHKSGTEKGKLIARCRLCINWWKLKSPGSHHGYVDTEKVLPFYREAVNRAGLLELARRAHVSPGAIENVLDGTSKHVRKMTARKVMLELVSMQRKRENPINQQARWRRDKRNNKYVELCEGCGTPKTNSTIGCGTCRDRHYHRFRKGFITEEEWLTIKERTK